MVASIDQREPFKIEKSQFSPKPPSIQKFTNEGPLAGTVEVFSTGGLTLHQDAQDLEKRGQLDLSPEDTALYHHYLQLKQSTE